jgi:MFS family permease
MDGILRNLRWIATEFGLTSLYNAERDVWLIILTRFLRMFAYGTNSVIMALFFAALQFSDSHIGLFMTLTLIGDVLLSFMFTLVADKIGRRRILFAGSVLMVFSGISFALFENYWVLLFAAVVGVISATGSEIGPFRAVEESTISHLTTTATRSDVLAWYVTTATFGSSVGSELCGRLVEHLAGLDGWVLKDAYHAVFWVYTAAGLANMGLLMLLSRRCEADSGGAQDPAYGPLLSDSESEDEDDFVGGIAPESPLELRDSKPKLPPPQKPRAAAGVLGGFFSKISPESRSIMLRLSALFAVDSLGGGMAPWSFVNYYVERKHAVPTSALGDVSSAAYLLGAASTLFAAPLSRRIGLINTMVWTHLPSSVALALIPAAPSFPLTAALLLFRAALSSMDQAPRAAFVAAVVRPEERTAVMGVNSALRTLAQSAGPSITGVLAGNDAFWVAFVAAGALKGSYDVGLWLWAMKIELRKGDGAAKGPRDGDEEARGGQAVERVKLGGRRVTLP